MNEEEQEISKHTCFYKIKESYKIKFEKILKKAHNLKKAIITKKKRGKEYHYYLKTNPLYDYVHLMKAKEKKSEKTIKKYKNYQKALEKIIESKDKEFNAEFGINIQGDQVDTLKDLFEYLDRHTRVYKYFYNKKMKCITLVIDHIKGLFILDLYKDRIIEGILLQFDIFKGFHDENHYYDSLPEKSIVDNFQKSLNALHYKWAMNKFKNLPLINVL